MGIQQEALATTAQIEPIIDQNGNVKLQVFASFTMRLQETFNITGPDGPSPANDTVVFYLNFLMKPTN